jgi:hypothetical protein
MIRMISTKLCFGEMLQDNGEGGVGRIALPSNPFSFPKRAESNVNRMGSHVRC